MKRTFIYMIIATVGVCLSVLSCANSVEYKTVNVQEFKTVLQEEGMQLLDARTIEEYNEGHIDCAVQISVKDADFEARALETFDKNRPVAVYCRSGRRSAKASEILTKAGFKVINLDGGYEAFIKQ
ncbi:rhodanese-like domain-containing protein [Porphyromonas cangingivalis]|uniref:Rhodanese-related sulfurtransferase n=2 Tax=Porphyromonas cangingivalis TaxID=36874 RepID=A0A1T4JMN6_PORCN|nr:rhodanese-like domain-containing protein [Porphyromonas cangingivalis]SJZ31456.1 Rhodanese-related sulfurtransferase [Porphyromonas cangingivalis]SPY35827.1 Thiosulfate sulfurtransferase PspE precursor [Porphyromonas cangingivalis]VEJ04424.1 Thiosulfate sulfurtransferase PspE precursor [Porphyromonas cangingivalis]